MTLNRGYKQWVHRHSSLKLGLAGRVVVFTFTCGAVVVFFFVTIISLNTQAPLTLAQLQHTGHTAVTGGITTKFKSVSRDVHVFYYMWYARRDKDAAWAHWNHPFLPHWDKAVDAQYPHGRHNPDAGDIGSAFWPRLGPYSSRDRTVVRQHVRDMRKASIGVAVLSWYPKGKMDDQGIFEHEELLQLLLDEAAKVGLEVAIHVEPYTGRTALTVRNDVQEIFRKFGDHPALHRRAPMGRHKMWVKDATKKLPVFYIYDSYHNSVQSWAEVLYPGHQNSIRGTHLDAIMFCLWAEPQHESYLSEGGFDGAYTYFAATGFTYGSTPTNWHLMQESAAKHGTMFIPSVGPGYNDVSVRPWNGGTTRPREFGRYFDNMIGAAIRLNPSILSITSWNEWGEGTSIEPVVPRREGSIDYPGFEPTGPEMYLNLLRDHVMRWAKKHT